MTRYVARRLLLAIPVLIGIMTAVFILLQLIPGDPAIAMAGEKGTVESVERIREELGLNRPLPVQYARSISATRREPISRSSASCANSSEPPSSSAPPR
jgi:ABC-type dipeptide/oligopeptide/nickel transport system permease component